MKMGELLSTLPQPVQIIVVLFSILVLGATGGKAASDFAVQFPILKELRAINELQAKSLCIQVAQLRNTDWTYCLVSPHGIN